MGLEDRPGPNEEHTLPRLLATNEILKAHGIDVTVPDTIHENNTLEVKRFLAAANFPPDSNFGQFVILRYAQYLISRHIQGVLIRGRIASGRDQGMIHPTAQADALRLRDVNTAVIRLRKEIGDTIFGNQAEAYATGVFHAISRGPTGNSPEVTATRKAGYATIGREVRENFPKGELIPNPI